MTQLTIQADTRTTTGRKTNSLRAEGKVPAVVYGFEIEPMSIEMDRNELERLFGNAGGSTVVELNMGDVTHSVLIQDIQRDPLTGFIVHADFRRIDLTKKVESTIDLSPVGEAPAVKEAGGTLIQPLEYVEVLALPNALVREITFDISGLKTFDDVVRIKDISIPEGIEVLTDPENTVALVQPPRKIEELEALDEAVEENVESVEIEGKKPEEGEDEGEKDKREEKK
ncbi:MAG: 50S ribosomal protein L25 [bacterium]